ncbi:TetR/AcrR family transcriptional regulator [Croceicoccus sp. YJ47]|uniref:TetR/AcrR family transcriptional regulator n=1 Tax=Croceicoccus sp. YJ47 TaxID=2798724 RepID=UPI0019216BD5|nr:TetR/AcrR family transcriptional regulator [Croceicoccus sp. YJ47]QQN74342.1 TetR/AcrR family transcriptional regulator [Croceicoccus sp. YJ47]
MTQAKNPYHKENLRRDLLDAGRDYLVTHGHTSLSIRSLAQIVGVSPGAPYHHFPDRRSLLLALAIEGYEEMMAGVGKAVGGASGTADQLEAMGVHFIAFSKKNPHLVELMYESELTTPTLDRQLLDYQIRAHKALRGLIAEHLPDITEDEADVRTIAFWSAVYGFANMLRKGLIYPDGVMDFKERQLSLAIVHQAVLMAIT